MSLAVEQPQPIPPILEVMSKGDVHQAMFWLNTLGEDWRGDVPRRLHEQGVFGLGSSPPFSPEFIAYVGRLECRVPGCDQCARFRRMNQGPRNHEVRLRTTRSFRKLRKVAPREFDALYMYCVLQYDAFGVADELTKRAIRLDHPERYDLNAAWTLILMGIDKVRKWW